MSWWDKAKKHLRTAAGIATGGATEIAKSGYDVLTGKENDPTELIANALTGGMPGHVRNIARSTGKHRDIDEKVMKKAMDPFGLTKRAGLVTNPEEEELKGELLEALLSEGGYSSDRTYGKSSLDPDSPYAHLWEKKKKGAK